MSIAGLSQARRSWERTSFAIFSPTVRDVVGGRSSGYEKELRAARETALAELAANAQQLGANAVVGVDWTMKSSARIMGCSWSALAGLE